METHSYLNRLEIDMKLRGLSPCTINSYRIHVTKFLQHVKRPVEQLKEDGRSGLFNPFGSSVVLVYKW